MELLAVASVHPYWVPFLPLGLVVVVGHLLSGLKPGQFWVTLGLTHPSLLDPDHLMGVLAALHSHQCCPPYLSLDQDGMMSP